MNKFTHIKDEEEAKQILEKAFCKDGYLIFYSIEDDRPFNSHGIRFKYYSKNGSNRDFVLINDFEIINVECGHLNSKITTTFRAEMALEKGVENYLADLEKFLNAKIDSEMVKLKKQIHLHRENEQ